MKIKRYYQKKRDWLRAKLFNIKANKNKITENSINDYEHYKMLYSYAQFKCKELRFK